MWDNLAELSDQVSKGQKSAVDLVELALKNIEENKDFDAILEVNPKALDQAKQVDQDIKDGKPRGKLAGIPFIAKDNFLTFDTKTTAASNILKDFQAPYQATAIDKLEEEGAIMVAKANLDAFAHGSSTENSDFGPTKNPHDQTKVPGGSSGGSAAAVALDMAPFALGTDTGGSIRLPASYCGVVGYKPTYGLVSRYGVIAMASSTDVIGPITRSTEDAAYLLDILSGIDSKDSTTIAREDNSYHESKSDLKDITIGVVEEYFSDQIDPQVSKMVKEKINQAKDAGAKIKKVSIKELSYALPSYYVLVPAEISSNLARYDGVKYGHSSEAAKNLDETYELSRSEGFGEEAKRRIMIGTYVLSSGYYDAYYKKAQTLRTKLVDAFEKAFEDVDVLVGPTAPDVAFDLGQKSQDPLAMYLVDILTVGPSLVGLPAISLPIGSKDNLPVGIQIIASQRQDSKVLSVAKEFERLSK